MDIIFTFIVIFLLLIFWHYFFKVPSYQIRISPSGLRKIPKLLLRLAKVEKGGDVTWKDLSKTEKERVIKYYEKLQDVSSTNLTFLYSQNLVHIQLTDKSYFFPLDKNQNYLVREEIGRIDEEIVEFVLYRRPGGWFKSSTLIGYLKKDREFLHDNKDKEVQVLFEFPEALVKRSFFTQGLENTSKLKKLSDVVEGHKNELGYDQSYFLFTSYDQEHQSGSNFNFLIHY